MMNQNIHTQLQKLIGRELEENNNNSRKVIKMLKDSQKWESILEMTGNYYSDGEILYNFLYPKTKYCPDNKLTFISFSVGYIFCEKKCKCCIKSKSDSVIEKCKQRSPDIQRQINKLRENTNIKKYGVENIFKDKEKIKQSIKQKYGVENVAHISGVSDKIKNTCLIRYGVENPAQNPEIKKKQLKSWSSNKDDNLLANKLSIKKKYGVDYPGQIPGVRDKIKNTCLEKYGVDNSFKLQRVISNTIKRQYGLVINDIAKRVENKVSPLFEITEYQGVYKLYSWKCNTCDNVFNDNLVNGKIPDCKVCNPNSLSNFERDIRNLVCEHDICRYNDRTIIKPLELDIVMKNKNIAIECDGVYWHSELSGKNKKYHLNKTELCEKNGVQLIHIWDNEWKNKPEIVSSILNSYMNNNSVIYARKCTIRTVPKQSKTSFLTNNHLQGDVSSSYDIGLYYNDELVSIMTFGKSRYNKKYEWELIRYCQKLNHNIVGGASRLFLHFTNIKNPTSIITYSDRRWFTGNMYRHLGFEFLYHAPPNYFYFKTDICKLESRVKYQKHKLSKLLDQYDSSLTEWENMKNNGYDRIWDCGNSVWGMHFKNYLATN